jgi:aldehyde dehydrogenase
VAPAKGRYFTNKSPVDRATICEVARSDADDVESALNAAHAAKDKWARTSPTERAKMLNTIADRIEDNLELLTRLETRDNGKPIRETMNADVPLAADHFHYFAGCIRAEEGTLGEIDHDTVAYHFREPLGVVGQITPWNFPLLMAARKLAPALVAGNCVVIKPASDTPMSLAVLMDLIGDVLSPGVLNVVFGHGSEVGAPLARSPRIAKIAFTGETTTGRQIMQYAAETIIPMTLELKASRPTSSSPTSWTATTLSSIRRSKGSHCSRSTRARCARVRRARWCRSRSSTVHGEGGRQRRQDQGRRSARSNDPNGGAMLQGGNSTRSWATSKSANRKAPSA